MLCLFLSFTFITFLDLLSLNNFEGRRKRSSATSLSPTRHTISNHHRRQHHQQPRAPLRRSAVANTINNHEPLGHMIKRDHFDSCDEIHSILEKTLQAVGAKAMVVGHTPQFDGVNSKYNCSIWRVDVGMSSGVLNSRPEVLEIVENKARVLRSTKETFAELQALDYT